jgi:hypothetical protein
MTPIASVAQALLNALGFAKESFRQDRLALRDAMLQVLERAQKQRPKRQATVQVDGRGELGWVTFERHQMYDAVLRARAQFGKAPIPLSHIKRVEDMACGHVDYSSKFALYCAELALRDDIPPP